VTFIFCLALWTRRVDTFEPGKVTVLVRGPFQRATQQIDAGQIGAIEDYELKDSRRIELRLADTSRISIVNVASLQTLDPGPLGRELAELLGKPLRRADT